MYKKNFKNNRATHSSSLDDLVKSHALTPDGKEWLLTALDPFHDFEHQISGYPDADVSQTVVACYQYESTISAPLGAVGNWGCHVYSLPLTDSENGQIVDEAANWSRQVEKNPAFHVAVGPLNIYSWEGNGQAVPNTAQAGNSQTVVLPATGVESVSSGTSRIIAMGFEVHNTTADIYRQGSVTSYRMPQNVGHHSILYQTNNLGSNGWLSGQRLRAPPTSVAEANLLKGTRTWEAKDGIYATCCQNTVHNPLQQLACQHTTFGVFADAGVQSDVMVTSALANGALLSPSPNKISPYDTTGAIFTGLSVNTTLTVKVKFFVERAPTWRDADLAVLASPSAGYDVNALQLYAAVINMLPPAVMVGENAKGDWFRAVMSVIRHVAAPLGMALNPFVPGAGIVGNAVAGIAGQVDNTIKSISSQSTDQARKRRPKIVSQNRPKLIKK